MNGSGTTLRTPAPDVSIVMPTHNRSTSLRRALDALVSQDFPSERMEVVVVADGCVDDSLAVLATYQNRLRLTVIDQENQRAAASRNNGAARASSELLIFLDDDVEPVPSLVSTHVAAHAAKSPGQPLVVAGYYPPVLSRQGGIYRTALMHWWESNFDRMGTPGRRFSYHDLLAGNFSISKALFQSVGGFRTELWMEEDWELGLRLIQAGAVFKFERAALSYHHEFSDVRRSAGRKFAEGKADVRWARFSPEMRARMPMSNVKLNWRALRISYGPAVLQKPFVALLYGLVGAAEWLRLRRAWRECAYLLFHIHYGLGLRSEIPTLKQLRVFLDEPQPARAPTQPLELDLQDGLETCEALLDRCRPEEVVIRYRGTLLGCAGGEFDRERFHGGHLRPLLANELAYALIRAIGTSRLDDTDVFTPAHVPVPV